MSCPYARDFGPFAHFDAVTLFVFRYGRLASSAHRTADKRRSLIAGRSAAVMPSSIKAQSLGKEERHAEHPTCGCDPVCVIANGSP